MRFTRCDQTAEWAMLQAYWQTHGSSIDLRTLFANNPSRFDRFMLCAPHVQADLSRSHWDETIFNHLQALAKECQLEAQRDAMFAGEAINSTEKRPALHTVLRAPQGSGPYSEIVHAELQRFLLFAEQIRSTAGGVAAGDIHDVVCLGIGGSYLGPQMAIEALDAWVHPALNFHFVSNIDPHALNKVLRHVRHQHTLFVVVSKTFTTTETLANALTARQWFIDQGGVDFAHHFVAVTANLQASKAFGIETSFAFWDWVGGRFSMWSSVGLSIALGIGRQHFLAMLAGAHSMDMHFLQTPLAENLPVALGLLDVWNRNFVGLTSRCISPYSEALKYFPSFLQQLLTESNGKCVDRAGQRVPFSTSDVVWGETGTNGQHAFFQMLHQGTDIVPVEFIVAKQPAWRGSDVLSEALRALLQAQHQGLMANALAQSRALMLGRPTIDLAVDELTPHRAIEGNRPSLTLLLDQVNPTSLGALVALYEHRTFVAGALWGINSFDQWGVELGKEMYRGILPCLLSNSDEAKLAQPPTDSATMGMLNRLG